MTQPTPEQLLEAIANARSAENAAVKFFENFCTFSHVQGIKEGICTVARIVVEQRRNQPFHLGTLFTFGEGPDGVLTLTGPDYFTDLLANILHSSVVRLPIGSAVRHGAHPLEEGEYGLFVTQDALSFGNRQLWARPK